MKAFFLPLSRGNRLCLLSSPERNTTHRGAILFIHSFAEEMNKSRRMAALQARALAAAGWSALQIDLFGCGDSDGDFGDATWSAWVSDVLEAAAWLRKETGTFPALWGIRTGCLLAVEAARHLDSPPKLLLWQPTVAGGQFLQQFLRLKLAGQLLVSATVGRTGTEELRASLRSGEPVEISGYTVSPALASGLESARLSPLAAPTQVAWLEIAAAAGAELTPAARQCVKEWLAAGSQVDVRTVQGLAFWQTLEIAECPELIGATMAILKNWHG